MSQPLSVITVFLDLLQWFTVIWFNLILFRLPYKKYVVHCVFAAILCHFIPEYAVKWSGLSGLRIFFQMILGIFCFWKIFMLPFFYAVLIFMMGSVLNLFIQLLLIGGVRYASGLSVDTIMTDPLAYALILGLLVVITFLIGALLIRQRWGFSFANMRKCRVKVKQDYGKFVLPLCGIACITAFYPTSYPEILGAWTMLLNLFLFILIGILLRLSMERDLE